MAEADSSAAKNPNQKFEIQRVYTKDLSFETPNSPAIFREKGEMNSSMELNISHKALENGVFEVVLAVTVTSKLGDKTVYLVEVQQAGIFTLAGFGEQEMGHLLNSFCPNILFPYARETVSNLVTKGSFPQLVLSAVNFDALYAQRLQQQKQAATAEPGEGAPH